MKRLLPAFALAALLCASSAQAALQDIITKGSTDRSVTLRIVDSTDGTPETGVVFNTSGIDLWYRREGAARTAITEATLAALTTAHSDGGFLHISDGEYRLDLPDAAFATGANYVDFGGTVTGMIVIGGRVKLVDVNLEDATRAGLAALPNAAAAASGGLLISGSNSGTTTLGALTVTGATTFTGAVTGSNASNDLRINGATPGASGGLLISGSNSGTTTLGALTVSGATTLTGAVSATNASNDVRVNTTAWGGTAVGSAAVRSNVIQANGSAVPSTAGVMDVNTIQVSGDPGVADRFEAMLDSTCGAYPEFGVTRGVGCTAVAYTAGTPSITLDAAASFGDNTLAGATILICSSTLGYCQPAIIASNVGSTDVATLAAALPVAATGTITYTIFGTAAGGSSGPTAAQIWSYATRELTSGNNIVLAKGTGVTGFTDLSSTQVENAVWNAAVASHVTAGTAGLRLSRVPDVAAGANGGLPTVDASNRVAGVSGNVVGSVGSVVGSVGGSVASVTGNVGGNVVGNVNGSVGSFGTTAQTNAQAAVEAALNAHTIGGEFLNDVLCRIASGMYGVQATDPSANAGNGQSVFRNPSGSTIRFTVDYGTDAGDRETVTLGASCGN